MKGNEMKKKLKPTATAKKVISPSTADQGSPIPEPVILAHWSSATPRKKSPIYDLKIKGSK